MTKSRRTFYIVENCKRHQCKLSDFLQYFENNNKSKTCTEEDFVDVCHKAYDYTYDIGSRSIMLLKEDCSAFIVYAFRQKESTMKEFKIEKQIERYIPRNKMLGVSDKNEKIEGEIWKDVEGYECKYQISNKGRVRSLRNNTILSPDCANGYARVHFGREKKVRMIHRLVAQAFIPNPSNLPQVNHKNGIKTDNRVENLEWCTALENFTHSVEILGVNSRNFTYKQAEKIRKDILNGKYKSIREVARKNKVSRDCITDLVNNTTYKTKNSKPIDIFKKKTDEEKYKIPHEIVNEIRRKYTENKQLRLRELSDEYDISQKIIFYIISNKIYKDDNYIYEKYRRAKKKDFIVDPKKYKLLETGSFRIYHKLVPIYTVQCVKCGRIEKRRKENLNRKCECCKKGL